MQLVNSVLFLPWDSPYTWNMFLSESASLFFFWWYYFEVQLCCQAKEEGKKPSKDKALKQQSALIAVLAMTALFFSFITNTLHQPFLCPPAVHSSLLFNILSCDSGEKWPTLPGFTPPSLPIISLFVHRKQTHLIILRCAHFFSPLHLPLEPLWTLEVTYLNSFSSHPRWAQKDIKPELFIMI